jgi:hypothetical protein|tara:strand:+ start:569 stop:754 length:186 start_codon:yes stop_codon:yes gene_type:complete
MIKEGPMKEHIERSKEGVIKAEYITYTIKDGRLVKDTSIRNFKSNGDYNDSYINEPLVEVK